MKKTLCFLAAMLFSIVTLAEHGGTPVPGEPLVIDVRTPGEYQQGHVRQAINIPYDEIAARIAEFVPKNNERIVLYCRSGRRSSIAEDTLRQLGYQQIDNKGGLEDMLSEGYRID